MTSAPSAVSLASGRIDVVARTKGDVLSRARFDGTSWVPWKSLGGTLSAAPAASADRSTGTIRVVVRGGTGVLYDTILTATGTSRGYRSLGRAAWSAPGITQGAGPLLVSRNGTTPAVVRGSFATAVGGALSGAPAAVSRSGSSWVAARPWHRRSVVDLRRPARSLHVDPGGGHQPHLTPRVAVTKPDRGDHAAYPAGSVS